MLLKDQRIYFNKHSVVSRLKKYISINSQTDNFGMLFLRNQKYYKK